MRPNWHTTPIPTVTEELSVDIATDLTEPDVQKCRQKQDTNKLDISP